MCDCFHLAFPNWHAASSGTGPGRRLRGPEPGAEDDSVCDKPSQFTEGERPRPQGSSPVEEFPESEKYSDSDKECEAEHDPHHKSGSGKKRKKSGLGSMFEKRSTPKMSKLKETHSPESGVIVKTAKDGCAEGLVYGGGGKEGIFIKGVVPESPASKSLKLKEGDQLLSATVYFDNVSYEDAIQILEHAQNYKVKLCLKRKPEITETEPAIESDVIPEEELGSPEMREQGKTKRRGDARISWPKFPSFGKGRKSRFTRSHSSSEADEQRKLELSPTTSDTDSPIKSQDALKGKKRHRLKLSSLKKRGRVSSSEDQDTDIPTTGQIDAKIVQSHEESDMLSPEYLESPGESPVYATEELKEVEEQQFEQKDQTLTEPQTVQHKVELITIDSTLKTTDLTAVLAEKGNSSPIKSPDGKKKKKERSELKMKILGKDKSHKKDAKAKASPKRLKTLGASIEIPDQPVIEKSEVIPSLESQTNLQGAQLDANTQIISSESSRVISVKPVTTQKELTLPRVELDIGDVPFICKSPKKGEKTKKGKDIKQKQETKTDPTFKLPKIGLSATEETLQQINVNVKEHTAGIDHLGIESAEIKDPYEQLSYRTHLPKREEIEIPGMEDLSTTAKRIKVPRVGFTGHYEELHAETLQMSIDVDSVKEAVSKLPGYKLPKVDTSGVPIPEEITVIDANAQRISVKTPTKVVDTKMKHEAHFTQFEITASPEISKTEFKLPKIPPSGFISEDILIETKVDVKNTEKKNKTNAKQSDPQIYKREDILIPGSAQEAVSRSIISDVKIPEIDGIEYIDSVDGSPARKDGGVLLAGFGVNLDAEEQTIKLPKFGELTADITEVPKVDANLGNLDVSVQGKMMEPELKIRPLTTEGELDGRGGKFKIPKLAIKMPKIKGPEFSKKDVDVTLPEAPGVDATLGSVDVSLTQQKLKVKTPELEIKPLQTDGELDGQGSRFKMPKLGIAMSKVRGPEIDSREVKRPDFQLTEPSAKMEIKATEIKDAEKDLEGSPSKFKMFKLSKFGGATPNVSIEVSDKTKVIQIPEAQLKPAGEGIAVDIKAPNIDIEGPSLEVKTAAEHDGKGSKFKMPKFGKTLPKVKGTEIDLSLSKKDVGVTLPETEVKLPECEHAEPSVKIEVKAPEFAVTQKDVEGSPSKFKMPTFKLPKFGVGTPKVPDMDKDVKVDGTDISIPEERLEVNTEEPSIDFEGPSIDVKTTATEQDGKGHKFKMPHLGFSMPKVKGPKIDLSLSKGDAEVTLPESKADVKLPEVDLGKVDVSIPEPKIEVPEVEMKPQEYDAEVDSHGAKFRMPKFGIKMPKVKGPEFDLSLSKKDKDVKLPETKADVKLPEVDLGKVDVSIPEPKIEVPEVEMKPQEYDAEVDSHGAKFRMPKFGIKMPNVKGPEFDLSLSKKDKDVKLPETKADVKLPEVDLGKAEVSMGVTNPELEMQSLQIEGELDGKGERLKMPKFGIKMPKVKGPEFDLSLKKDIDMTLPQTKVEVEVPDVPEMDAKLGKAEVSVLEAKVAIEKPEMDIKPLQMEADGHGSKLKMPKFGMGMPRVKGPEFNLGFSKKDVDVTLPEAKADVPLPGVELKEPSAQEEMKAPEMEVTDKDTEGSSKFKMPHFSVSMPKVKGPDIHFSLSKKDTDAALPGTKADVKVPGVDLEKGDVLIPEAKVEVQKPEVEIKPLQTDVELEGRGGKFKMPKFGITLPKVKGPDIDLSFSKKDVDVTLPEAKAEVKLPEAPNVAVDMKPVDYEAEIDGQGSKFKMPKFGISLPKVQGPDIDVGLSKKDVDITLPEANAQVKLPDVELKEPSAQVEIKAAEIETPLHSVKGSPLKFKMPTFKFPKFGITTPSVSAEVPDVDKEIKIDGADLHLSAPNTDVGVPEVKAEIHLPEVEVKEPSSGVVIDQQPSVDIDAKIKKPRFSLPRLSFSKPSVKAPEVDVSLPDVNVGIPGGKVEMKGSEMDIKSPECEAEVDVKGSKYKMPKFGITMPKVTGPEIDLSLSKTDADVTLPGAKAEVKLPDVELKEPSAEVEVKAPEIKVGTKTEGFKMPTLKLPKFGFGNTSADMDKDVTIDGADIKIPEEVLTVDIAAPSIDTEGPTIHMETTGTEQEAKGGKFKMPSLGFSAPQIKRPDIDFSLPKKDVDVTLPEAKAEVKLPDVELKEPSAEVEIKAPEVKVTTKTKEGSPSKFKMPTFKLPKFGIGTPTATVEVPNKEKDVKIDGADMKFPEEVLTVDIAAPSIDTEGPTIHMETTGTEQETKGGKFKMPSLAFSAPQIKRPDIDFSLSKKDVDVTLPEAKAEVKLPDVELKEPSAEVEIKAPEFKVTTKTKEGSPSKFKMPTFKLPKFGIGTPTATVEVPDMEKDVKIDGADIKFPEEVLTVDIAAPSIDTEGPTIHMETTGTEQETKGGKFKMPSLAFSAPQIKRPDIDFSLSKKDVGVTLPEAKAEVKLPDVELKEPSAEVEIKAPEVKVTTKTKEGSPSKFKMPTFKLPKFGIGTPTATVEVPDMEKDVKIDGADMKFPEEVLTVDIAAPSIDTEGPTIHMKTTGTDQEAKGGKFKMPSLAFSAPQIKHPDIDFSLSKKDVDVTLPEAKAEVKLPDVELKEPSAEVEIKAPEIKVTTKTKEGSPSKFKMPTFKLPKFGIGTPTATVEVPDLEKDVKIDGVDIKFPEEVLTVDIAAPSIDTEGPTIHMKTTGTEQEAKGGKFKMPSLGFSAPQIKRPDIDFSLPKKDVDVTLPEAKAEVKLPDVELKEPSAEVEIKAPEIKVTTKTKEGSPSKFKMPTFKLPKFGIGTPTATVEVPDLEKDVKIDGVDIKFPEEVLTVDIAAPSIDTEGPTIHMETTGTEQEAKGGKFKMPSLGFSAPQIKRPDIDFSLPKKDVDVTLPEAKAEVKLPDVELKKPSAEVEITGPGIDVHASNLEGAPSKFKMPTFRLPKFGSVTPQVSVEVPDVEKEIKVEGKDLKLPETKAEVKLPDVEIKDPEVSISVTQGDSPLKKTRFSLPKFSFSKQSMKEPVLDASLPDVDISLPKENVEVTQPEGDVELDGQESKFKMPKFGLSMPKVKGPEIEFSLSKKDVDVTLPEAKADLQIPDVKVKQPSAEIEAKTGNVEGSPLKLKMPTFTLPKIGAAPSQATVEVPNVDKDIKIDGAKVEVPKAGVTVDVTAPSIDTEGLSVDVKAKGGEVEGSGGKFKMPSFGLSMPKVKGPEIEFSLSKKDVDVPEAEAEAQLPDVKLKEPSGKVEIKSPEIEAHASPSKLKMPTFTLPKFGAAAPKVSAELPKEEATVDVTAPTIDPEDLSVDVKAKETESKFKMPNLGITMPKVKGPNIEFSLSKRDEDVTVPGAKAEVNLSSAKVEEPEVAISVPDAPTVEAEAKLKRPSWTFPKFSFSRTNTKAPDVDVNLETAKVEVASPEIKAEVCLPNVEVQGPSGVVSPEEPSAAELDVNLKKSKFSLPRFSFSKSSVKEPEVSAELPHVAVSLPEGEVTVKQPEMEIQAPELETEHGGQASKFKLPKFGFALPKAKGPEEDLNATQKDVTLPEVKAEVKLPEIEAEAELKDVGGSPLKFKMPTMKMPKLSATYDVTVDAPDADKVAKTGGTKLHDDATLSIKGPSVDVKMDESKAAETETPKTDSMGLGSPSKFKLPSFKMPTLNFSRPKPEDVETESKDDQLKIEQKEETKSPKMSLTSFGDIFKGFDVEFDVPKPDKEEETPPQKEDSDTNKPNVKQSEPKEQGTTKSPERTGWFKFPKFGLSSPSEPAKTPEKDEQMEEKSPAGETSEISPTSSVQSSDAFADISSAMTSEHAGLSLSSPTKVTVKYSDPNVATEEMKSNIVTSTTRTELISVEPNLPEKITILSSGVSSSSEDTLRLESGKIHIFSSNIQATPEAQQARLLTAVQVQPAGGPSLKSETNEATSWTVGDSQSGKKTIFERHFVKETSSEISESKETIVITKQITHIGVFDPSEPISGETASSIQRLRDSVHSEKMRFFDGAEK